MNEAAMNTYTSNMKDYEEYMNKYNKLISDLYKPCRKNVDNADKSCKCKNDVDDIEKYIKAIIDCEFEDDFDLLKYYNFMNCTLNNKKRTRVNKVIFNDPATIIYWSDGTKTVVKCMEGDTFSEEAGIALCICKKIYGDNFKKNLKDLIKTASRPNSTASKKEEVKEEVKKPTTKKSDKKES